MKKNLSILLVLTMLLCMLPTPKRAEAGAAANTVTFTAGVEKWEADEQREGSLEKDGVVLHCTKDGANGANLGRTDNYRFYSGETITITAPSGSVITKIEFTSTASGTANYGPSKISADGYAYDGNVGTWTNADGAESVAFTTSAQFRATLVIVTLAAASGTPTPTDEPTATPTATSTPTATPEPTQTPSKTLVELNASDDNTIALINEELTVVAKAGSYCYVVDALGNFGLIYKSTEYVAGDVLAAGTLTAKKTTYNALVELVPQGTLPTATPGGTIPTPIVVTDPSTLTVADQNKYVCFANAKVSGVNGKNATLTVGEKTIALYNSYNLSTYPTADAEYSEIVGFVTVYKTTVQIAPMSLTTAQGPTPTTTPSATPEPTQIPEKTAADLVASDDNTIAVVDSELTVVACAGKYCYVADANGKIMLIYATTEYKAGDKIAAKTLTAKKTTYSGLVELVPQGDLPTATPGGTVPTPVVVADPSTLTAADQSKFVVFKNVKVSAASGKNAKLTVDGKEIALYNNLGATLPEVETAYAEVTGFISVYGETVQIYPLTLTVTIPTPNTGVSTLPVMAVLAAIVLFGTAIVAFARKRQDA